MNPYKVDSFKNPKPYNNISNINVSELHLKSKSPGKTKSMAKLDKSDLNHLLKGNTSNL